MFQILQDDNIMTLSVNLDHLDVVQEVLGIILNEEGDKSDRSDTVMAASVATLRYASITSIAACLIGHQAILVRYCCMMNVYFKLRI